MAHRILLNAPGGVEELQWQECPVYTPAPGEVLLRQVAVGVNFIDIYHRSGLYPLPAYPAVLGMEAAGVVEAVGQGVSEFAPGDRVAYAKGEPGAYAQYRLVGQERLVPLPDGVDFTAASAGLLKGLTAHYLLTRTFPVQPGDTVLVHAAAGGVGLLLCQWAKLLGATVIGTVGSDDKAMLARAGGCDHVIVYTAEKVAERVKALTRWRGVDVVYDSVGQATFLDSLDCLKPMGMMVSFGQSSGRIPPVDVGVLAQKGSLYLARPTLATHIHDTRSYRAMAGELFALIESGKLRVRVDRTLALKDAANAHRLLESRTTTGAVVLLA